MLLTYPIELSSPQYLRFFLSCITIAIALTEYRMFTTTLMYGCSMYNFIVLRWGVSCWRGIISLVRVSVLLGIRVSRWWLVIFLLLFVWSVCLTINSIFCLNLIYVNMLHVYSYFMSVRNEDLLIFFNSVQHLNNMSNPFFSNIFGIIINEECPVWSCLLNAPALFII